MKTKSSRHTPSPMAKGFVIVLMAVKIALPALADGWGYYCQLYSRITPDPEVHCSVVDFVCSGTCKKYGVSPGGQDCGFCAESWNPLSKCISKPVWYVTFTQLFASCEYHQVGANPESVQWKCECGTTWVQNGTIVNGCYCP